MCMLFIIIMLLFMTLSVDVDVTMSYIYIYIYISILLMHGRTLDQIGIMVKRNTYNSCWIYIYMNDIMSPLFYIYIYRWSHHHDSLFAVVHVKNPYIYILNIMYQTTARFVFIQSTFSLRCNERGICRM